MFLRQYQRQRKCFLSERELKKALRDTLTRAAWLGPVIFDWFVQSMRMQVILDSSFARPGSAPIWGGRKESSGTGLCLHESTVAIFLDNSRIETTLRFQQELILN